MSKKDTGHSLVDLAIQAAQYGAGTAINVADQRQSLSEFSAGSRMAPPVLVESSIARLNPEVTHSIMQTLLNIYVGHYLSVVSSLTKVGEVSVKSLLDPLADPGAFSAFDVARASLESFHSVDAVDEDSVVAEWDPTNLNLLGDYSSVSMEAAPDMSKPVNLAVGKIFDVPLQIGTGEVKVQTTIALLPRALDKNGLLNVITAFLRRDNSMMGRWHRYMAGEFKSFKDYAFGLDLAKQDLSLLINDPDGFYKTAKAKQGQGLLSTLISGKKSMNVVSSMVVLSKETARDIETNMRGKLSRSRDRAQYFNTTNTMILCVVDTDRELVRIYQRGIEEYGDYTYDDLSPAATNQNAFDVNAIMRAYNAGQSFSS